MEDKEKRNKIIGLSIGIIIVMFAIIGLSYAYWQLNLSQSDHNVLIGGCLDFTLENDSSAIRSQNVYPISDFEGVQTSGYTFTITNKCKEKLDYRIDLDSIILTNGNYLSNNAIALQLDYYPKTTYAQLETIPVSSDDPTVHERRIIIYDTVFGKDSDLGSNVNHHTLRLWIDESSQAEDQSKEFEGRIHVIAGQGITKNYTPAHNFTFENTTGAITAYNETGGTNVIIPGWINNDKVKELGNVAFQAKNITGVELPRTITVINSGSFVSPSTYTGAFYGTSALAKVVLKDGLVSVGDYAFSGLTGSLSEVYFPQTVTNIGIWAFGHQLLKYVIIPDGITSLGEGAFGYNPIKHLKIGTGLNIIPTSAFINHQLEELIIPDNITVIGRDAFASEEQTIKKLEFGTGLTTIKNDAFEGAIAPNTVINIPSNVVTIESEAFGGSDSSVIINVDRCASEVSGYGTNWSGGATVNFKTEGC